MARAKRGRQAHGMGSVFQRKDGLWAAVVDLGRDPLTGKRVRRSFAAKSQAAAIEKRSQFAADLDDGAARAKPVHAPAYTVATWLDYWLENIVQPDREPTTYDSYEVLVRLHLKPLIGAISLKALEVEHVEGWLRELRKRNVGLRTRQVALSRLRTALNVALRRRQQTGLRFNPATLVEMPRGAKPRVEAPNLEHAKALLDAARGDRLETFVTVGLALGLRRGEAAGLKWEDVDLDARVITVRRRVSRVKGALVVREGTKMNPDGAAHAVALPDMMVQALRQHRTRQLEERMRAGPRWKGPEPTINGKPAGYVFTSVVGTVLEPRNVYRSFESMRHRAGLDEKTFHQLRHDCASLLLAQGVPMYVVSQILRHSSPTITARFYAHMTPELQREAADQMDKLLGPLVSTH